MYALIFIAGIILGGTVGMLAMALAQVAGRSGRDAAASISRERAREDDAGKAEHEVERQP